MQVNDKIIKRHIYIYSRYPNSTFPHWFPYVSWSCIVMRVLFQFETLFMFSTQYKKFRNYVNFLSSWFPTTPRISLMTYIYCVYFIFNFKIEILKLTWSVEKSELQNGEIGENSLSLSSTTKWINSTFWENWNLSHNILSSLSSD